VGLAKSTEPTIMTNPVVFAKPTGLTHKSLLINLITIKYIDETLINKIFTKDNELSEAIS